jgi:hypothetical protein
MLLWPLTEVAPQPSATEIAPSRSRTPSRTARKRDERVRRVIARLRRDAPWLQAPRYGIQLRAYAILWVRFENLHAANSDALDEMGKPHPVNDALARIAGSYPGLAANSALARLPRRSYTTTVIAQASHAKWIAIADGLDEIRRGAEVVTPSADANGTPVNP